MKVLFLISLFLPVFSAYAERSFSQYTCQISHKLDENAFYLDVGERKEVDVAGWTLSAGLERKENEIEVSLSRIVTVMDATYKKDASRRYPLFARTLPVELEHSFGGRTDLFSMICYPRDP